MFSTKRNLRKNSTTRRRSSRATQPSITIKKDTRADVARAKKLPGTTVSVEHVDVLGSNIKGDLVKEYKNGKLQKQVFVTKDKMKNILSRAEKRGGAVAAAPAPAAAAEQAPQRILVQDDTTAAQSAKGGLFAGFGFGIGIEAAHSLFGAIFGDN